MRILMTNEDMAIARAADLRTSTNRHMRRAERSEGQTFAGHCVSDAVHRIAISLECAQYAASFRAIY